jgi:hypothetical protein
MMDHMGIIWEHKGKKKGERGVWGRINDFVKCQNLTHE